MGFQIRPITPEELPALARNDATAFGGHVDADDVEEIRRGFDFARSLAVFEDGQIVGTAGAYPFELSLPGGTVTPVSGVSWVAVWPTHRRRGILRALMSRQLDDLAARGEALAILTASESGIYGRFGYGIANSTMSIEINPHRASFREPVAADGWLRLIDREEALALLPEIYDRVRRLQPGALSRSAERWQSMLGPSRNTNHRDGVRFFVVHESSAGQVDGAATYRIKEEWPDDLPANILGIREILALTPAVYAALWQYLLSVDLVGRVRAASRPVDEPLRWLLAEPRRLRITRLGDELWARLLDIPAALAARRYATEGALVLDVRDPFRPQNEGRYALDGSPDGADCTPTTRDADLVLGVDDLAAVYLGGERFSTLARGGRVHEAHEGALRRADALFAAERAPFCGTGF